MQVDCPRCHGIGSTPELRDGDLSKATCPSCGGTSKVEPSRIERIWWGGNHIERVVADDREA